MVHDKVVAEESETMMESSTYNSTGIFAKELEDELMKFTASQEETSSAKLIEQNEEVKESSNLDVNITECSYSGSLMLVESGNQDATESSSSFGNSESEIENVEMPGEAEIMSDFRGNGEAFPFDGFGESLRMRKKKLTNHWRSFIEPLMWRCKWTELQILKFQSQAKKYDGKLKHFQKKKLQFQSVVSEGHSVKSCHFSFRNPGSVVHRRKKRKRFEESVDIAAYMSQHNLLSYYESRKHLTRGPFKEDDLKNRAIGTPKADIDDELWMNEHFFLEAGDGDNSLDLIFGKIESLHAQVVNLKTRIEKVMSEDTGKFSSVDELNFPIPLQSVASSINNSSDNGVIRPVGSYIASQLKSEHNGRDALVPENAVTVYKEMSSDVNGSTNHICFDGTYIKEEDEVLIDNLRAKDEMNNFQDVKIQPLPQPIAPKDDMDETPINLQADSDASIPSLPPPKTRSVSNLTTSKSKRKRPKRKGAGKRRR